MSKRQIAIKPSCLNEIRALPIDRLGAFLDKVQLLANDPLPDGGLKKKLRAGGGVCRLRVGSYRVLYRFGEEWVTLLGLRRRREDTYRDLDTVSGARAEAPPELYETEGEEELDGLNAAPRGFSFARGGGAPGARETEELPVKLTAAWLTQLGVPAEAIPTLLQCTTAEALLDAPVPEGVLKRVVEAVFPKPLEEMVAEPELVVPSTEHLVRYRQGDLLNFLLRLDEAQARLTRWSLTGPTMVVGGAGTGKSTVALYRVKEVLERPGATGRETVLLTTFTNALLSATRQLLSEILSEEQMARVEVATADHIAVEIVKSTRRLSDIEYGQEATRRLHELRARFVPRAKSAAETEEVGLALAALTERYLIEEFDWIIDGRGIPDVEEYKRAPRPGRGARLSGRLREAIFALYQRFAESARKDRFPALRNEARAVLASGAWEKRWDYVIVDEAQDLCPASLALMAEVARTPEGLFFAADSKQSLYSRNYTWSSAHPRLQFRGRTARLERNYRSTKEIDRAAFAVLEAEDDETLVASTSVHEGPLPVLVRNVPSEDEATWIADFVRQMARHLRLRPSAAAVLVPRNAIGRELAEAITEAGLPARFFEGRALELRADAVKVLTLHSAKGLEFPIVVVAGFHEGAYPVPEKYVAPEVFAERMRHERRLLYVGLTRAMRGLMLIVPRGCRHEALTAFETRGWAVEETE